MSNAFQIYLRTFIVISSPTCFGQ